MISTKKWIIIIALILIAAIIGTMFVFLHDKTGTTAKIVQDGNVIETIDLSKVQDEKYITVEYEGRSNTILIKDGKICVFDADCPDQVCVNMGWIPSGEKSIVCLPNRLVISIIDADSGIDGATS
jgi:hypothetical protein